MSTNALRIFVLLALTLALALAATAQQASLTLKSTDCQLAHYQVANWSLTKTVQANWAWDATAATVPWTVTATRGANDPAKLVVVGYLDVTNTGSAPATIGNIVVNLQAQKLVNKKTIWQSVAADVATAAQGDAATSANIIAAASAETTNNINYTVTGAQGTFTETAGSGKLEFSVGGNTVWALVPQKTIAVGETVELLYTADFTGGLIPVGQQARAEVIVSFGNVGPRGNGGASATGIDVNGNGILDADEQLPKYVRSVPNRKTIVVPALATCNDTVTLSDSEVASTDNVTFGDVDFAGLKDGVIIDDTTVPPYTVIAGSVANNSFTDGSITNTARLAGAPQTISIVTGSISVYDETTLSWRLVPTTLDFTTYPGFSLQASATAVIPGQEEDTNPPPTVYCTYTQGGYHGNGEPFNLLAENFTVIYPQGVEVGIPGTAGYSMKLTTIAAVQALSTGGGKAGALTSDLVNPTKSSAGVFGWQVLALQFNVDLSNAGTLTPGFAGLTVVDAASAYNGQTVAEILALANQMLGGGLAFDNAMNTLVTNLNESFDAGTPSAWATTHLQ